MASSFPIVLVEVDRDSRLHIYQHDGVRVALIDRRIEPALVLLPAVHQPLEIDAAIGNLPLRSLNHDDLARTAAEMLRRLIAGDIVVAATPVFPEKEPTNG